MGKFSVLTNMHTHCYVAIHTDRTLPDRKSPYCVILFCLVPFSQLWS